MPSYSFIVFSNPADGREDEFNAFYTGTHFPDMLKLHGFVEGQRFKILQSVPKLEAPRWRYAAIYTIETDDIRATMLEMKDKLGGPELPMSDCFDGDNLHGFLIAPITEKLAAKS